MEIGGSSMASAASGVLNKLENNASTIAEEMNQISSMNSNEQQTAMIKMNFKIGQYNAMLEMTSNVIKKVTDGISSIASKT